MKYYFPKVKDYLEVRVVAVTVSIWTGSNELFSPTTRCMNLTFNDAAFVERPGSYKYFPTMFLPSRMIRDVIIPDDVSAFLFPS